MNREQEGGPDFGIRLIFFLIDAGLLVGASFTLLTSNPASDGHWHRMFMFFSVLGLTIAAAVGVVRRFALYISKSAESSEAAQNE